MATTSAAAAGRAEMPFRLSDALVERFGRVKVADLADGCRRLGFRGAVADPELRPGVAYQRLCGIAVTVRTAIEAGVRDYGAQAADLYDRGRSATRAIVVQQNDVPDFTSIGSGGARIAAAHGYTGWVTSGPIRDTEELRDAAIPVFGTAIRPSGRQVSDVPEGASMQFTLDVPVVVAGVTIRPGDVIVADHDGMIALAPDQAEAVLAEAEAILEIEARAFNLLAQGLTYRQILDRFAEDA